MLLVVVWRIITHLCCQHDRDHEVILPANVEISKKIFYFNKIKFFLNLLK